ncbi:MAG: MTH1187 family thiamine-binding protein [Thermoplasmatales archaeon]|nr:MAG: MTH1187 family thiamine-binding protein [Thermoplasmatales archaeon]
MIISQLSIAPVGEGTSLSSFVRIVIDTLRKHNVKFATNDMATILETENLDALFRVVKEAHNAVIKAGAKRVITELKIDDRKDKEVTIGSKVKAVN